ncbi:GTPase IMAP family member 7 [Hippoglossus stenolepis]|uniref:GTPase IMAP family member 7 n=1 Tax=Hippoglossus stenolepis TaxID=195615 RepID=UPI00159C24DD|nr:GTPase IMAP family member 7 [Hippoglossus stenolepis]
MSAAAPQSELRLVVLGRTGPGQSPAGCTILGLQDSEQGPDQALSQECKHRGEAADRQLVVVSGPAWFSSGCSPEDRRRHISSVIALSSPGPHAFLLCVPVNQPTDGEDKALDALTKLFGPSVVSRHTIVLFTHTEELEEDEELDEYLVTWRKDLQELVDRCGGRYHTLETRSGEEAGERDAVQELLEKVEQMVKESEPRHLSCPLYDEAEERVRERQVEVVRRRRAEELSEQASPTDSQPEEDVTEEELESVRDEAERSVGDLDVDVDDIFPSTSVTPSSPSFLQGLWEKLTDWLMWLPRLVRREALFGSLVSLFMGGPFGRMLGATVGSVATEVGRRKTQKTK